MLKLPKTLTFVRLRIVILFIRFLPLNKIHNTIILYAQNARKYIVSNVHKKLMDK